MSVPISRLRRWLKDQPSPDEGDLLGVPVAEDKDEKNRKDTNQDRTPMPCGVLWRGSLNSVLIGSPDDLQPGDTLVLPASTENKDQLGHLPGVQASLATSQGDTEDLAQAESPGEFNIDMAEAAFHQARDRASLRLHRSLRTGLPTGEAFDILFDRAADRDNPPTPTEWQGLLKDAAETWLGPTNDDLKQRLGALADVKNGLRIDSYPDNRGVVLTTRNRLGSTTDWYIPVLDDGIDDASTTSRTDSVKLKDHTEHVAGRVQLSVERLPISVEHDLSKLAAQLHDLGKADERFQALLRRTNRTDAWLLAAYESALLAKSDGMPQTRPDRIAARLRSGLPDGFRHEMFSLQLAERSGRLPTDPAKRDLVLHLIAAHHGHARPFAPVVLDDNPPCIEVGGINLTNEDRLACPPHRLDSGVAERFWSLTRRFGWWGLAYLESILRLADQQASAAEDAGVYENNTVGTQESVEATI